MGSELKKNPFDIRLIIIGFDPSKGTSFSFNTYFFRLLSYNLCEWIILLPTFPNDTMISPLVTYLCQVLDSRNEWVV